MIVGAPEGWVVTSLALALGASINGTHCHIIYGRLLFGNVRFHSATRLELSSDLA